MDFFEVLKERRSVRAYERKPIEEEKLQKILEAINSAPSAGNLQAYEVVLVRDPERIRQLARASHDQTFIEDAPVVLAFVANPQRNSHTYGRRGEYLYCMQDATVACSIAHLTATALGLSSCWIGAFDDDAVAKIVGAKPPLQVAAILPIAYPAEHPSPRPRRPLDELVHRDQLEG